MHDNRNRWTFFDQKAKPRLSNTEVNYWKNTLSKIVKIGGEFEFNLPEQKGVCKGDSPACPCAHLSKGCWEECASMKICLEMKNISRCENKVDTCEKEDCKRCEHYKPICHGIFCGGFVSMCLTCKKFTVNCDTCDKKYDSARNPDDLRSLITMRLGPNQSYGLVSKTGVHSITVDGSLTGNKGVEIITVGRRLDYWEFYSMFKNIINTATEHGGFVDERCSIHMHMLGTYYGNQLAENNLEGVRSQISELEKSMPQIILANLHQLIRRYQNAMTWMMMGLNDPKAMTRWEKYRVSVLPFSAALNSMKKVQELIVQHAGKKYGWVNYNPTQFDNNGDIKRFHIEFRAMDGLLCPSAVAAFACMYYGLLIKAVEISRYGIVEVGDCEWMNQAGEVKSALMNNMKGYDAGDRFSDNRNLPKYFDFLRRESFELIRLIKHILLKIGPAYGILEALAEKPIALRRCAGESWEEIEETLAVRISEENFLDLKVQEFIDLGIVTDCNNITEWTEGVAHFLKQDPEISMLKNESLTETIRALVEDRMTGGEMIWSNSLGQPIKV